LPNAKTIYTNVKVENKLQQIIVYSTVYYWGKVVFYSKKHYTVNTFTAS